MVRLRRSLNCCFLLLRVADAAGARGPGFAAQVVRRHGIDQIGGGQRLTQARQIAFTAAGLRALEGAKSVMLAQFSPEFAVGLAGDSSRVAPPRRYRRATMPAAGRWGSGAREPHVLLMLFDESEQIWTTAETLRNGSLRSRDCREPDRLLDSGDMGEREPFGFIDGVSANRAIDWTDEREPAPTPIWTTAT